MKIYSWFIEVTEDQHTFLAADAMRRWRLHAQLCCDPSPPAVGQIVAVDIDVEQSDIDNAEVVTGHADYVGASDDNPAALNAWLVGRGVSQADADSITGSGDIAAAMRQYIMGQS